MAITNKPVYINIARPSMYAVLYAKQSDVNRAFTAVFNNDGEAWAIPENAVVSIWYRGAAGEGNYTKGIEINGNTAVVPLIPQMLSVPGTGLLCIIINTAAGDQIGTWNIPYFVEEIPGGNSEAATEFYTAFSESVAVVTAAAKEAANEAAITALEQAKASGEFDGEKGDDGEPGKDGVSATHKWEGTTLTITSASGTSSANLKGDKGDTGAQGAKGADGQPGKDGAAGKDGADGKSAYQYAVDAGYTGTEEEFAKVLASGGYAPETETVLSDNLLDKSLMTKGQVFYYGGSGHQLVASTYSYYGFIPLRGAGTYRTKFQQKVHESTGTRIALVNDNNTWVANTTGTCGEIVEDKNWVDFEFVVTQEHISAGATKVAFDVYSGVNDGLFNKTMIVKDREYPSEYIPFGYIEVATDSGRKQNNVLCEKTAVFLGDSICAGTTVDADSPYYNYGWGGIIGEANRMNWKNYGKNGGTITHRGADSTCIAKIADTAIAEHPNADYVIFEGGCNDADQMKDAGLGVVSSDYATFDTTTFSGALEALILKLVTAYPHAKIGYIIPQKMYKGYSDYTAKNHIHRKYFDRAVEICQKWGIPVVDIWNGSMLNPKLSTASIYYVEENGQHLTETGYLAITPMIEAWMRNLYVPGMVAVAGGNTGGVTSWNDLTDKPFDIVEVLPETQFVYDESLGAFVGQSDLVLVPGRKYIVNWNGVEYTTTARYGVFSMGEMSAFVNMVGNPVTIGGENNGLPFALAKMLPAGGGMIGAIPLDGSTSVTVSIKSSTFYETSDTLMLDSVYDQVQQKVTLVYATPERIAQAFFAGKRIVAITAALGVAQMVLTSYLPVGMTTGGLDIICFHIPDINGFDFYQMKYNGDGTYVPYSD